MSRTMDISALIRAVKAQGFTVEFPRGEKGRCRVTSPSGAPAVMPGPGQRVSARGLQNARAQLRRIGADL